jgi:hypothetical protein
MAEMPMMMICQDETHDSSNTGRGEGLRSPKKGKPDELITQQPDDPIMRHEYLLTNSD